MLDIKPSPSIFKDIRPDYLEKFQLGVQNLNESVVTIAVTQQTIKDWLAFQEGWK